MNSRVRNPEGVGLSAFSHNSRFSTGDLLSSIRCGPVDSAVSSTNRRSLVLAQVLERGLSQDPQAEPARNLLRAVQGEGLTLETAFRSLPPDQRRGLSQTIGERPLEEIFSLSHEPDDVLFSAGLSHLARNRMEDESFPLAISFFQAILQESSDRQEIRSYQVRARESLELLGGGGSFGARVGFLGHQFIGQATRTDMLIGMGVAGVVFQTVRLGALGNLLSSSPTRFAGRAWAAEAAAWSLAFPAELSAFTLTLRGVNEALGNRQDWSGAALEHDFFVNGLGLLSLKVSGAIGGATMRRIQGTQPSATAWMRFSEAAIPQAAMLTGLLASHAAEVRLGLRSPTSFGNSLMDSLAMLLQFNVAGQITQRFLGGDFQRHLDETNLRLKILQQSGSRELGPIFAITPLAETPDGMRVPGVYMNGSEDGPRSSVPPPLLQSRGSTPARESTLPREVLGSELYRVLRRRFSGFESDLGYLQTEQAGQPLWAHQTHRVAGEVLPLLDLMAKRFQDLPALASDNGKIRDIRLETARIYWMLEGARSGELSMTSDQGAPKEFMRAFYKVPHALNYYLESGNPEGLRAALDKGMEARGRLQQFLDIPDTRLPKSQVLERPFDLRLYLHPDTPQIDLIPPAYTFGKIENYLEIPGRDRQILLLGEIPIERLGLSEAHLVKGSITNSMIGNARKLGITVDPQRISPGQWNAQADGLGAEYLEAYDFTSRDRLLSPWGSQFVAAIAGKLRPGGVGLIVMEDAEALRAAVNLLVREGHADILLGSYHAPLPIHTSRGDAEGSNYVFFRRLMGESKPFKFGNGHAVRPIPVETAPESGPLTLRHLSPEELAGSSYRDYPIPDINVSEALKSEFGDLELDLYHLYQEYSRHQDWIGRAQEINRVLIPLVEKTEQTVHFFRGSEGSSAEFSEIVKDLREVSSMLEALRTRSEDSEKTIASSNFTVEEYLRNMYRCVNRFGNYLINTATLEPIHSTVKHGRDSLQNLLREKPIE